MGRISEEDVARVRDATDVVALISESVVLKPKGRLQWGLCPFHGEKTPSFKVDPATQLWHCFGCGEGGDVFGFLMRRENLEFPESVRILAERARIDIVEEGDGAPRGQRERLVDVCEATAAFYHHELTHSRTPEATAAREYLGARGFGSETARTFTLGFAPGRGALVRHLRAEGFSADEMVTANVAYNREGSASLTDRFYDRVMFPIRDLHGRVIAFGGRVIGAGEPKYLNSSDTPVFQKSANLYAIEKAKNPIVAEGVAVVVEGYTDVIALHEAGLANVVATLGTALTRRHVSMLGRFAAKVVYLFDGDEAGMRAAARAAEFIDAAVATPGRREVELTVALLPDRLDPADLVAERGADAMREVISAAEPLLRFAIDQRLAAHTLTTPEGRARALRDSAQVLAPVKATMLGQEYVNYLADRLMLDYATVKAAVGEARPQVRGAEEGAEGAAGSSATRAPEHLDAATRAERALVAVLVVAPHLRDGARRLLDTELLSDPVARMLIEVVAAAPANAHADEVYRTVAGRDSDAASVLAGLLVDAPEQEDVDSVVRDLVIRLKDSALERRIREMKAGLKELEASGDRVSADEVFRSVAAMQAEREDLRRGAVPIEVEVWGFE